MSSITVVQARTPVGEGARRVYVGRPGPLGNPFPLWRYTREESVDQYDVWLLRQLALETGPVVDEMLRLQAIARAQPLELECHCAPLRCHADVIKRILEETL